MPAIYIEPLKIKSIRNATSIVTMLRSKRVVAEQSLITITVNGFDEYSIKLQTDSDEAFEWACALLNSNQSIYNHYCTEA